MKLIQKKDNLPFNITKHGYVSSIYFNRILDYIVKVISKNKKKIIKVLDYGCGNSYLKERAKKNKKIKIIGYDIVKELTDVLNWKTVKFDIFVSCHVFTYLKKKEVEDIIKFLKKKYPDTLVIVAITRQGWLNKFGTYILNEPDATPMLT